MSLRMISDVAKVRSLETHCPLCGRPFTRAKQTQEHIFPRWLQEHHGLASRKLTIPNLTNRLYKSVRIGICIKCNSDRYGKLEKSISRAMRSADAFDALLEIDSRDLAAWLGKIVWLLCRKSHAADDYLRRDEPQPQKILPEELLTGVLYLGLFQRAYAMKKGMVACFRGDPPFPEFFYGAPYSLYRYRIDTQHDAHVGAFDFVDNIPTLSVALRSGEVGLICLFDGGLHRHWRSDAYDYLAHERLHPFQFKEVIARMIYDQTVLEYDAHRIQYYWNRSLNTVVSELFWRRVLNPYVQENTDPARLADILKQLTTLDHVEIDNSGPNVSPTLLKTMTGEFNRRPVIIRPRASE